MAGIGKDWLESRAGCGRKMPDVCKKAYADFWIDRFITAGHLKELGQEPDAETRDSHNA